MDLFLLAIEGPDVVLGFPWLQFLGKVTIDYSTFTLEFMWNGKSVTLVVDTSLASQLVSLHRLQALVQKADIVELFAITHSSSVPHSELDWMFLGDLPIPFTDLLKCFVAIFTHPQDYLHITLLTTTFI